MNTTSTTAIAQSAPATKRSSQPAGRTQPPADNDRADFSAIMNVLDTTCADIDSGHVPSNALIANSGVSSEEDDSPSERTDRAGLRSEWNASFPYQPAVARLSENAGRREQAFDGELSLIEPNATGSNTQKLGIRDGLTDPADKPSGSANGPGEISATGNSAIAIAATVKRMPDSPNQQLRTALSNSPDRLLAESTSVGASQARRPALGDPQLPQIISHAEPGTDRHSATPAAERPLDASIWSIDGPSQMAAAAGMLAPKGDVAGTKIALAPTTARSREPRTASTSMESLLTDVRSGNNMMLRTDGLAGVAGVLRMGDDRQAELTRAAPTAIYGMPVIHSDALLIATVPTVPIAPAIANPQWAEALGGAVMRITAENLGEATLIVSPAELGTISVKIDLDGQQVSVSFLVGNTEVHRAVEAALPRLQEMMAQSGLSLGQSSVSQEQPKSPFQAPPPQNAAADPSKRGTSGIGEVGATLPRRVAAGRVDLFA